MLPSPFPRLMSVNPSLLGPEKRMESAEMDLRSSVDPTCCCVMEEADPAQCASGMPDAICSAVGPGSVSQGYVGVCAMEQASGFQGYVEVNDVAAADNLDSSGTVDYTCTDTAGTVFDPGTESLVQPRVPSGTVDVAVEMEAQTDLAPIPASMSLGTDATHSPLARTIPISSTSRRGRNLSVSLRFTSRTSVDFRDATLWFWRCGGWSAGIRRASRLKDPCRVPTKTGADVVYHVTGGYPPKAHVWRSDHVSGAPERIPIIKGPQIQTTSCKPRRQSQVTFISCIDCELH